MEFRRVLFRSVARGSVRVLDRSTPSLECGRRRYHTLAARCPPRESSKPRGWETVSHVAGDPPTVCFGYTRCDRCVAELYFWTLLVTVNYRPVRSEERRVGKENRFRRIAYSE